MSQRKKHMQLMWQFEEASVNAVLHAKTQDAERKKHHSVEMSLLMKLSDKTQFSGV